MPEKIGPRIPSPKNSEHRCIVVLGMHRSGTSCLAGALEHAGVYLGNVSEYNPHNLKGNRENPMIMKLHNNLLEYNSGSWDNPPAQVAWSAHLIKERDTIISTYRDKSLWGFKDPRTLLTLDGWLDILPKVSLCATYRHPALVVESLRDRNPDLSLQKGLYLWEFYNNKLLHYYNKHKFPIIPFDLEEIEYKEKVRNFLSYLDMGLNLVGVKFYDRSLQHHNRVPTMNLPNSVIEIYNQLQEIAW